MREKAVFPQRRPDGSIPDIYCPPTICPGGPGKPNIQYTISGTSYAVDTSTSYAETHDSQGLAAQQYVNTNSTTIALTAYTRGGYKIGNAIAPGSIPLYQNFRYNAATLNWTPAVQRYTLWANGAPEIDIKVGDYGGGGGASYYGGGTGNGNAPNLIITAMFGVTYNPACLGVYLLAGIAHMAIWTTAAFGIAGVCDALPPLCLPAYVAGMGAAGISSQAIADWVHEKDC